MLKNLVKSFIKKVPQKIVEKEIYTIYEHLLDRSPNSDEIAHWITIGSTSDMIRNELLQSYELWQRKNYKYRVLVTMPGFKIYAMQNDPAVGSVIIHTKSFEKHVTNAIRNNLKAGDVFVDLGANIGFFTLLAASLVKDSGKVLSVEPNMQNLQLLYASVLENNFNNINILPFAASDRFQILSLTSFGSNGLVGTPRIDQTNSQFLQSVIIDELLKNESKISFVKLDIEGYEPLAIKGMDKLLRKHGPIIVSEFSPWHISHRTQIAPREYLRQLFQYDYSLNIIEPSGDIITNTDIDLIMNYWAKLNDDKQHLDLIAYKNM